MCPFQHSHMSNQAARGVPPRTAKEKLRERIETFTEEAAAETLQLLDRRTDPLTVLLENAPLDDEPVTDEEEAAVQVAREEIARGRDHQSRRDPS